MCNQIYLIWANVIYKARMQFKVRELALHANVCSIRILFTFPVCNSLIAELVHKEFVCICILLLNLNLYPQLFLFEFVQRPLASGEAVCNTPRGLNSFMNKSEV